MQSFFDSLRPLLNTSLFVAAAAILLCLVLGGATRSGFLSDVVLQLLSIPLLMIILLRWADYGATGTPPAGVRFAFTICGLILLLHFVQLLPLPSAVWGALGGRAPLTESYGLIDQPLPWRPISVVPHATWLALLSFIPAITVFLATLQVGWGGRRILTLLIITFGGFSVCYGLLQVAQGPQSPLRLYAVTNPQDAVGLFANRNHYAALLYCVLALALAWTIATTSELAANAGKGYPTHLLVPAVLGVALVGMLIVALGASRSRAGIGLTAVVLVLAMMLPQGGKLQTAELAKRRLNVGRYAVAGIILVFLLAGSSSLLRVLERFEGDPLKDSRIPFGRNTIEAALAHMPFGSGIGTFPPVYATYEKAVDVTTAFANRAHNDILEAWLETGLPGALVFALFIAWLGARAFRLFRSGREQGMRGLDGLLALAACTAVALLLVHSLVDYPLRTAAISGLFAFLCALLLPPPPLALARETGTAVEASVKRRRADRPVSNAEPGFAEPGMATAGMPMQQTVPASTPQPNWSFPVEPASAPAPAPGPTAAGTPAWPTVPQGGATAEPPGSRWGESVAWPEAWTAKPASPTDPVPPPAPKPFNPSGRSQ